MRTRIALVAIIPVALITVSTLTQAATVQSARAAAVTPTGAPTASPHPSRPPAGERCHHRRTPPAADRAWC